MLALALWEQPRSAGELWQGVDCGHCQRAAVVRARLTEIHVGFPQTQSLRLDRDAGGPTRPGPVAVISPDIASLSQKLSEALESRCHRRGVCTEIRELHWNLRGNVHSAVLYSWISTAARDQTTGRFSEKSETLGTEDRFSYCGRAIQGGNDGELKYTAVPCQRLFEDSIQMSVSRPTDLSSIHPFDHWSIYHLSSIYLHISSKYPPTVVTCQAVCCLFYSTEWEPDPSTDLPMNYFLWICLPQISYYVMNLELIHGELFPGMSQSSDRAQKVFHFCFTIIVFQIFKNQIAL